MKLVLSIIAAGLVAIVLSGCDGPEEPSQAALNAACANHGGVYHVERHEEGEESYMYLLVCEDKTIQRVYPP